MKGTHSVKKSDAQTVMNRKSSDLEKAQTINRDSGASGVLKPLFGKSPATKNTENNTGFSSGSLKATRLDKSATFPVIAPQNLSASKTIGSINPPQSHLIMINISISLSTPPISTRMAVS